LILLINFESVRVGFLNIIAINKHNPKNKTDNKINNNTNATPIHRGHVTHHQDQSITFINFSIRNTRNNNIPDDVPDDAVFLNFIIFLFKLIFFTDYFFIFLNNHIQ
jgi:hypothetical protein